MHDDRDAPPAAIPEPSSGKDANRNTMKPGNPSTWPREIGGQSGPEPTRYGDWEKNGRCTDF